MDLNKVKNYWLIVSTILTALLIYMYDKRGNTIKDLAYKLRKQRLETELEDIRIDLINKKEIENNESKAYEELKRRYPNLVDKHGITQPPKQSG